MSQDFTRHPTGQVPTIARPDPLGMKALGQLTNDRLIALAIAADQTVVKPIEGLHIRALRSNEGNVSVPERLSNWLT